MFRNDISWVLAIQGDAGHDRSAVDDDASLFRILIAWIGEHGFYLCATDNDLGSEVDIEDLRVLVNFGFWLPGIRDERYRALSWELDESWLAHQLYPRSSLNNPAH